jgi:4-oxalocrotonate tautomerase
MHAARGGNHAFPDRGSRYSATPQAANGGPVMPEVVIYALGGRSQEQKKALCKDVTDAVVKNYNVPADAVVVTLVESQKTDKAKGGVMFSEMPAR